MKGRIEEVWLLRKMRFQTLQIERGETIDGVDSQGMTPLMLACQKGKLNIVSALMARGANQ